MQTIDNSVEEKTSMMQGSLLNQEKPFLLPPDFQPTQWDITIPCGWVKSKEHSGNARFLEMCDQQLENYEMCTSKVERSIVIHRIVLAVMAGSPSQTGFVNRDKKTGRWHFIGMTRARERVGYVLRRAIKDKKAKAEKIKRGEPIEPKKKSRKSKGTAATSTTTGGKKQEQTGIAWRVPASKLAVTTTESKTNAAGATSKVLAMRRRKLPFGLVNNKLLFGAEGTEQASKRQRIMPTISLSEKDDSKTSPPPSDVISEALSIAGPTSADLTPPALSAATATTSSLLSGTTSSLFGSSPSGLSSSLYSKLANSAGPKDIYLEAAIREHAAMRESAALRELALREQAASAVIKERIALRDAMQARLALQEESILRERIKMHEEAAQRERLALQERLSKRVAEKPDMSVAEALAAAKAKKEDSAATAGAFLTPAQRAAAISALLGPHSLYNL
jgi:hypothetical protein